MPNRLIVALQRKEPLRVIQEIFRADPHWVREADDNGWLPLHHAAYSGAAVDAESSDPLELVRYLVGTCPEAVLARDANGCFPVHMAAEVGPADVVQYLADRGPDALLAKDNDGFLPLHTAASHASLEVIRCLVRKCPDALQVTIEDTGGGCRCTRPRATRRWTLSSSSRTAVPERSTRPVEAAFRPVDVARNEAKHDVAEWLEKARTDGPGDEPASTSTSAGQRQQPPRTSPASRQLLPSAGAPAPSNGDRFDTSLVGVGLLSDPAALEASAPTVGGEAPLQPGTIGDQHARTSDLDDASARESSRSELAADAARAQKPLSCSEAQAEESAA
jgi:Ankyrin repeats (3 copies)